MTQTYVLPGDPSNFKGFCHAVQHVCPANHQNVSVKTKPKA
jgi:hypothetical protein